MGKKRGFVFFGAVIKFIVAIGIGLFVVRSFKTSIEKSDSFTNRVYETLYEKGEINVFEFKQFAAESDHKLLMDEFVVGTVKDVTINESYGAANLLIATPNKERLIEEVSDYEIHLVFPKHRIAGSTKINNGLMYVFDMEVEDMNVLKGSKVFVRIQNGYYSDMFDIFIVVDEK